MDKKFKYAVTLCPAAVNAMEDINNSVYKYVEQCFEIKYSKEKVDLLNDIYYKVDKIFQNYNVKTCLNIKKVLNKEELDMLIKYKYDFLTYISKIIEKDPVNFFYFTSIIQQENFEEKLYVNRIYLCSIYYFLSQKKNEKEDSRLSFKNVISVNFDENKENLFQSKSLENVNLLQQMNDITDTLRNNNLLQSVKKDSLTELLTIDDKFFIKKNDNYISIENGNQKNQIGITIKKNEEDNDLIEIGNKEKGYFIINPTWALKKEDEDGLLKVHKNVGNIIKYYQKKNKNITNFLFTIADMKVNNKVGRGIVALDDSTKINTPKASIKNRELYIGKQKIGTIGGTEFGPYFNTNSDLTYYDCAKTSFVIMTNEEKENKKTIISSSGNEIKIVLVNGSSLLVFNLFLNDNHKKIYNFSYFKDNFGLCHYKGSKVDYDFKFFPKGNIYHILNKRFFEYKIEAGNNISGIFNDDEYKLECSLKRDIFELITLSEFNKYGFRQIIDKTKKVQVFYKNGNIFDFNSEKCELYKIVDNKKNTFMTEDGKLILFNKNLNCYIEIDHLCEIKFCRFVDEKRKDIELKDIYVDNYEGFINNILESYMKAYKYFEMYKNFYGENKEHDRNYYCIKDLYKHFSENKNKNEIKNENEINIKNLQNKVEKLKLNDCIDKNNILNYVVSENNKKIISELIKDSDNKIRIKIVNDLTDINGKSVTKYQKEKISIIDIINNRNDDENKYMNDIILFHIAMLINEEQFFYSDKMRYELEGIYHYSLENGNRLYFTKNTKDKELNLLCNIVHFKK